ncbi:MAG: hypoxanthine phosphoribosyltransferase [Bacilli bacterium]|nr:hypoxanthine phosphoribosyltransferase [Bacilli bacterium]
MMDSFIEEVLYTHEEIVARCDELGKIITKDYENKPLVLVSLLRGSVPFLTELMMHIKNDLQIDFMDVCSYHGATSSGSVTILKDIKTDIKDRHVIIVEDIVDTGLTLKNVMELLRERGASSIEIACLLNKPAARKYKCLEPKYVAFTVDPKFVVGFGLDYNQLYRNLDYVGVLKRSIYEK